MPFEWYEPDVPRVDTRSKALQMYERELADRAALLQRLGYSKSAALERLRGNVEWDFELHDKPEHLARVNEIVERVYARRGAGGGGSPAL